MKQYFVTGMSCAACSARVEKAVKKVPGVESCAVSLLTNSMGVEGEAAPEDVIAAVEKAGYGAGLKGVEKKNDRDNSLEDHETQKLIKRLVYSLIFLAFLMYVSMGHMMLGLPLPEFFDGNMIGQGILQMMLAAVVMALNQDFFISGAKSFFGGAPNMDTLVALGSGVSFFYSAAMLLMMTSAAGSEEQMMYHNEFYFESAAMILALITVGKALEARSKGKTTDAIKRLMLLAPKTASVIRDGVEKVIPVEEVKEGEVFVVRPGESIPVDGIVIEGSGAVDESALTGESLPVDKAAGEEVSSGTMNQSGFLKCRVSRVGSDTTLSRIIQLVEDAAATKAPIAKTADKISGIFVPVVILIAIVTTVCWMMAGESFGFSLTRGISVLVISCPCALGLATPVAIMVGSGIGARNGILFKTAASIEGAGRIELVALDKTGTITKGEPSVTDIIPAPGFSADELLRFAASLEAKSEHPLAKAVMRYALNIKVEETENFEALPGNGLRAEISGKSVVGGSGKFILELLESSKIPREILSKSEELSMNGKTPLFFAVGDKFAGIIAVADVIKDDSREAVDELRAMGIRTVMLTGDNEVTAKAIGKNAGVDEVIAGVLPDGKERVIQRLSQNSRIAMVGDGINDAPALTRADLGIAIGAGSDIAIDAADVVLMKSSLRDVPAAITIGKKTLRNIHENLFWAFFYNLIGIPLAAGLFIPAFGWKLTPMFGAAAMSLSSFSVVLNALRLNLIDPYKKSRGSFENNITRPVNPNSDKEIKKSESGANVMEKTMKIEGMTCGHCEARVKKVLEALPGVESASVSHKNGTAVLQLSNDVDADLLKKTVEDEDYTVISVG